MLQRRVLRFAVPFFSAQRSSEFLFFENTQDSGTADNRFLSVQKSSCIISLLHVPPATAPAATDREISLEELEISPQAKTLFTFVFWEPSTFIMPCSVNSQPNCA